jgi:hypothetical protein
MQINAAMQTAQRDQMRKLFFHSVAFATNSEILNLQASIAKATTSIAHSLDEVQYQNTEAL